MDSNSPRPLVFISYRYGDTPRFDQVREFAARLRFFSLEVILDQRSLGFGEDIRAFMADAVGRADGMIVMLSRDYNEALGRTKGSGAGIRHEVSLALAEKERRPGFQLIPVLLDDVQPAAPLDRLRCAKLADVDQIATQLGLPADAARNRVLGHRYRIDRLMEQRGVTSVFNGRDAVMDQAIEIYLVPPIHVSLKERFGQFERVIRGRSAAFSPFLLNLKDTHIDNDGSFFIVTERFEGTDLEALLKRHGRARPLGAMLVAYQVCLALHELHAAGVIHGGLAARAIRIDAAKGQAKIVDFEFATVAGDAAARAGTMEGYPTISPPERFAGAPASVAQDVYQLGALLFRLLSGRMVISRELERSAPTTPPPAVFWLEDGELEGRLAAALEEAVGELRGAVREHLAPLLARCLHPDPSARPSCLDVATALTGLGLPSSGHLEQMVLPDLQGVVFPDA